MGNCVSQNDQLPKSNIMSRQIVMNAESNHHPNYETSEIPNSRILCQNGCTKSACGFSKQGYKGVNQDTMLVWEGFGGQDNTVFCGIFDGHGSNGHLVARKVRDHLPHIILQASRESGHKFANMNESTNLDLDVIEFNYDAKTSKITMNPSSMQSMYWEDLDVDCKVLLSINDNVSNFKDPHETHMESFWAKTLATTFHLMDQNLKWNHNIDSFMSGTTAIAMIVQDKELVIGHVGDSRAILAKRSPQGSLLVEQLTMDLKPNLPGELERIQRYKGQVFALPDEPHLARLWSPYGDSPGLAMARSLGDFYLKSYGLSATPELTYKKLTDDDEFIVLATDGVWEVLSNDDVVRIVIETWPKEDAAKVVVDRARRAWRRKYGSWRMDDCTAICFNLKHKEGCI